MRWDFSRALRTLFSPETIGLFLLGTICIAVLGNAVTQIIINTFSHQTIPMLIVVAVTVGVIGATLFILEWRISQVSRLSCSPQIKPAPQHRGLILLVSKQGDACETAIRHHLPILQRCWLITGKNEEDRQRVAGLRQQFPEVCQPEPILIADLQDPVEFHGKINAIYGNLPEGWSPNDVISDYTGLNKHASVGMVLACMAADRPLEYTPAKLDRDRKAIGSLPPVEIQLTWGHVGRPVSDPTAADDAPEPQALASGPTDT